MTRLDSILKGVDEGKGTLGQLVQNRSLYDHADQTLDQTQQLVKSIRDDPKKYLVIRLKIFRFGTASSVVGILLEKLADVCRLVRIGGQLASQVWLRFPYFLLLAAFAAFGLAFRFRKAVVRFVQCRPTYAKSGDMVPPSNYREWVYLTTGST